MSYRAGVATFTSGSKRVTGVDTQWKDFGIQEGDQIEAVNIYNLPTGYRYEVASVESNTSLTLLQPYRGESASGANYVITETGANQTPLSLSKKLGNYITDMQKLFDAMSGIQEEGAVSICDTSGKVPVEWMKTNVANGLLKLNSAGRAAYTQLPEDIKGSGKNYLQNWYFYTPILQRGSGPWTSSRRYTISRWLMYGVGQVSCNTANAGGLTIAATGNTDLYIQQTLERLGGFTGRTVTFSVRVLSGGGSIGIALGSDNYSFSSGTTLTSKSFGGPGIYTCTVTLPTSTEQMYLRVFMKTAAGGSASFAAAKLEIGNVGTLHLDGPCDVGEENVLCGRFCQVFANSQRARMVNHGTNYLDFILPTSNQLRVSPSIESGEFVICDLQGNILQEKTIESMLVLSRTPNLFLRIVCTAHGLTDAVLKTTTGVVFSSDM